MEELKEEKPKKHYLRNTLILLILTISALIGWARFISTKGLIVKEYPVYSENLPTHFDGFKIIHFSDLHYGGTVTEKDLKKMIKEMNTLNPDIIAFTGDLFDKAINPSKEAIDSLTKALKSLNPRLKKYAVTGNHDYQNDNWEKIMEEAGFSILSNTYDLIFDGSQDPILISGLPSSIQDRHDYKNAFAPLQKTPEENGLEKDIQYKILLLHEPDNIDNLKEYNINLALAGHSHGGQIRIPFKGAIVKPLGAKKYYDDYYQVNNTDLYISSGIGTSQIKFRFLNKPSINLYRLYTKASE